jgi:uridine kinase
LEGISRSQLVEGLVETITLARRPHPMRVGIDGPDAAGKTVLADELANAIRRQGRTVVRASIDGFHRPRADRYARGRKSPQGYYEDSFDYPGLRAALLDPLGPSGNREYHNALFDLLADQAAPGQAALAPSDAILLFDGIFLIRPELRDVWDLHIFVSVGFEEVVRRAVLRDTAVIGSAEGVRQLYRTRYIPAQEIYFAAERPEETADVVVYNDDPEKPSLGL